MRRARSLIGVVITSACVAGAPEASSVHGPALRPSDGVLDDAVLQAVVDLQVARDAEALVNELGAERADVRARAALALASVQAPSALEALLAALGDPEMGVRRDAALATGQLGDPASVEGLAAALAGETDPAVRDRLLEALGKVGAPAAADALLAATVGSDEEPRRTQALAVHGAVGGVDHAGGRAHLLAHLDDPDPRVRRAAAYYFGRREDTSVWSARVARVREALDGYDRDEEAARYLVQALGRLGTPADAVRLRSWAREATDWRTRTNALAALGSDSSEETRELALAALGDPSVHVAFTAAQLLSGAVHVPSTLTVIESWIDAHPDRLWVTGQLLVLLARQDEREYVLGYLDATPATEERRMRAAIVAAGILRGQEVTERMRELARTATPLAALDAARVLLQRWSVDQRDSGQHADYYATFSELLGTVDPRAAYAVAAALSRPMFAPFGNLDLLRSTLEALPADQHERRAAILQALELFSAHEVGDILRAHLEHPDADVREAARTTLTLVTGEQAAAASAPAGDASDVAAVDWAYLRALGGAPRMTLETDEGRIVLRLVPEEAPLTVQTVSRLAEEGRYDGVVFHRVVPNFVVQGGDVSGREGSGGPGYSIRSELNGLGYVRGAIGMASAGKDTEGSQFFITHSMQPHLDGGYTVFGWVVEGMDVLDRIQQGAYLVRASVERGG